MAPAFAADDAEGAAPAGGLQLDRVSVWFGRTWALHEISLELPFGRTYALLGPNGAGKTTLLRAVATLQPLSAGGIKLRNEGRTSMSREARRRLLGYVSHELFLYLELTGRENLRLHADLQAVGDAEGVVERWLERVGLGHVADQAASTYSRGMKQRLALARALLHEPKIVLLDEPMTGLDRSAQAIFRSILEWLRDQGRLVLLVTHQLDVPQELVDEAILLEAGRLRWRGAADRPLSSIWEDELGPSMRRSTR